MAKIPIKAAKEIAHKYDYDQVVIIARKVGKNGKEHVTIYGKTKEHCRVTTGWGEFLKHKVMGWVKNK